MNQKLIRTIQISFEALGKSMNLPDGVQVVGVSEPSMSLGGGVLDIKVITDHEPRDVCLATDADIGLLGDAFRPEPVQGTYGECCPTCGMGPNEAGMRWCGCSPESKLVMGSNDVPKN